MKKLAMLMFTLCGIVAAQTYDLTGEICNSGGPEACTFHFSDGSYWQTGQYNAYVFTPPGAIEPSAYYCNPPAGSWTQTVPKPVPLNIEVTYTFGCTTATGMQLSAAFQAHSYELSFPCGVKVRTICHTTRWVVDSGFFMN
jgi:hypothetical protein